MADNVAVTAGSGTTIAADDISGVYFQRVKITVGADGTATDVSTAAPLPVSDAGGSLTVDAPVGTPAFVRLSDGTSAISTLPVSAASLPLPSGASTAAKQPALGTAGTASADVLTVQGIASMTALLVNGSGVTQPVSDAGGSLTVDAPVGTPAFVRLSDGSAAITTLPVSLASLPALAAGTNSIGGVTNQPAAGTTGGATPYQLISTATSNGTSVKGSAGQVFAVQLTNRNTTTARYLKFYNKATAPSPALDTPLKTITLPAAASAELATVLVHSFAMPIAFSLGIGIAITGGFAADDNTSVGENDVICCLDYK